MKVEDLRELLSANPQKAGLFGVDFLGKTIVKNRPPRELQSWSIRVLAVNALDASDVQAHWWGFHMERFVGFARLNCESFDLKTSISAYKAYLLRDEPAPTEVLLGEIRKSLVLLSRGIERWRWVIKPGEERASLAFRVKDSGINHPVAVPGGAVAKAGPHPETEVWVEAMRRSIRLNHYSLRTEQTYIEMLRRYLTFIGPVPPEAGNVRAFLEYLAVERRVSASTQKSGAFRDVVFFQAGAGS